MCPSNYQVCHKVFVSLDCCFTPYPALSICIDTTGFCTGCLLQVYTRMQWSLTAFLHGIKLSDLLDNLCKIVMLVTKKLTVGNQDTHGNGIFRLLYHFILF